MGFHHCWDTPSTRWPFLPPASGGFCNFFPAMSASSARQILAEYRDFPRWRGAARRFEVVPARLGTRVASLGGRECLETEVSSFGESATDNDWIGRDFMRTRSFHLEPMADDLEGGALVERPEAGSKQYARGRSARTPRRRSSRTAGANIPLGISARRNRRWAW